MAIALPGWHWDPETSSDPECPRCNQMCDQHKGCMECHHPEAIKQQGWGGNVRGFIRYKGCKNKDHYALAFHRGVDTSNIPKTLPGPCARRYRTKLLKPCRKEPSHAVDGHLYTCYCHPTLHKDDDDDDDDDEGGQLYVCVCRGDPNYNKKTKKEKEKKEDGVENAGIVYVPAIEQAPGAGYNPYTYPYPYQYQYEDFNQYYYPHQYMYQYQYPYAYPDAGNGNAYCYWHNGHWRNYYEGNVQAAEENYVRSIPEAGIYAAGPRRFPTPEADAEGDAGDGGS